MKKTIYLIALNAILLSCSSKYENKFEEKGFQTSEINEDNDGNTIVGLPIDSLKIKSKPRNVLLTKNKQHRLTPIFKLNYNKKTKEYFTGSINYHYVWENDNKRYGNNWNNNFLPGYSAAYGYNLINVSHFNNEIKQENLFFDKPVLIKTLYFPAFSSDTLNFQIVQRKHHLISVYDEDSNKDGYITTKDLRKFYFFDIDGKNKKQIIPNNYSVMSCEYDSANDFIYVFAKLDINNNGSMEQNEPTHIFWVDLKNPSNNGILYK